MGRQPKKCPKKCSNHHFHLKPVHYSAFLSRETSFFYCPQSLKAQQNIPKFNRDRRPFTASFILALDQIKLQTNIETHKREHERLKKQIQEQKSQIFMAKPKMKYNYCNVCKENFQDYSDHINSSQHKKFIQTNPFNKDILSLCESFQTKQKMSNQGECKQISSYSFLSTQFSQSFYETETEKDKNFLTLSDPFDIFQEQMKPLDCILSTKSLKSFQSLKESQQNFAQNNNLWQSSIFKQCKDNFMNQNLPCFNFKQLQCTASPIKPKYQKSIIISSYKLNFDS